MCEERTTSNFTSSFTSSLVAPRETAQVWADVAVTLRGWAANIALPLWATIGFDGAHGGFHERLYLDGTPDHEAPRRTRVQARQIYVFAHAAVLGWYPEGLDVALRAFEFMLGRGRAPDGAPGYVHVLAPDGTIVDASRDLYDHAFILLALGWLARATMDSQISSLIDETLAFLDEDLAAGDGTFYEGVPRSEPRRQNPHMHLFEAMLGLKQTVGHVDALTRAAGLRDLLVNKFLDPQTQTLGEYFTDDWRSVAGDDGDIREPGHHAEWAWLIRTHERLAGEPVDPLASALLDRTTAAREAGTGFLVDEVGALGQIRRGSRRLWPQTELAKAWLAESERGRTGAENEARRTLSNLATHYLAGPKPGLWFDQFDARGQLMTQHVPASSFYHVFCAIAEADRVLNRR